MSRKTLMRRSADDGIAMVIVMMMVAVLTALGATVFALSANNLGNAKRDRVATTSLANAEAGISQAVAYIRSAGVKKFQNCSPACGAANPWGQAPGAAAPTQVVTLPNGDAYQVWFDVPVQKFDAASRTPGIYTIHSIGLSGSASRKVDVQVQVTPFQFPLGVFSKSVQAGGSGSIHTESLFVDTCIYKRSKIAFSGVDPVYNIPSAAHSGQYITDSQGSGTTCPATDNSNIHAVSKCAGAVTGPATGNNNVTGYPFDQDAQGGDLNNVPGTPCYRKGAIAFPGSDVTYPSTSLTDAAAMAATYKYNRDGLTPAQLNLLATASQEQGFYTRSSTAIPAVLTAAGADATYPNPILFYDFPACSSSCPEVNIDPLGTAYGRTYPLAADAATCTGKGITIVVKNGNVKLNSNSVITGSLFAMGPLPNGQVNKANGNSQFIGTVYAQGIDLTGTADVELDPCFLANLPGQLLDVQETSFREVDR